MTTASTTTDMAFSRVQHVKVDQQRSILLRFLPVDLGWVEFRCKIVPVTDAWAAPPWLMSYDEGCPVQLAPARNHRPKYSSVVDG